MWFKRCTCFYIEISIWKFLIVRLPMDAVYLCVCVCMCVHGEQFNDIWNEKEFCDSHTIYFKQFQNASFPISTQNDQIDKTIKHKTWKWIRAIIIWFFSSWVRLFKNINRKHIHIFIYARISSNAISGKHDSMVCWQWNWMPDNYKVCVCVCFCFLWESCWMPIHITK